MRQTNARPSIAIIGAGICGLRCANLLSDNGFDCTLFDKSRGVGGRTSTRRAEQWRFDHGAGYFTATDPDFFAAMQILQPWLPTESGEQMYAGATGSNELAKSLFAAVSQKLTAQLGTAIKSVEKEANSRWLLNAQTGETYGPFDLVISTAPPPQAVQILAPTESPVSQRLATLQTRCTWALMLVTETELPIPDLVSKPNHNIARVIAEHSKPGRRTSATKQGQYVIQASTEFSQLNVADDPAAITQKLLAQLHDLYGPLPVIEHKQIHRWLHGGILTPLGKPYLWDKETGIAAAGDWCTGNNAEDAFISGSKLAHAIVQRFS